METNRLSPLSTPSATRAVLERHGLYTKYGLGQNFLVNDDVIRKILELADVQAGDCVLEVGPGIGTLTAALLQRASRVIAVEKDADLPVVLADTLAPWVDRFTLVSGDALNLDMLDLTPVAQADEQNGETDTAFRHKEMQNGQETSCPNEMEREALPSASPVACLPNKLVSNLPYAVAATVVLDYLQRFDFLDSATVMVQKEVADRMTARAGSKTYGAYTVKLSLFAQPAGRFAVAPGNFFPPPHVESAVLRLNRRLACNEQGEPLGPELLRATCTMADAAFATRRKTIANSCKTYFAGSPNTQAALPAIFEQAGIDPRRRGETLAQAEFVRLGQAFMDSRVL